MVAVHEQIERRMDERFGLLIAAIFQVHGVAAKPSDFFPSLAPPELTPEALAAKISRVMRHAGAE